MRVKSAMFNFSEKSGMSLNHISQLHNSDIGVHEFFVFAIRPDDLRRPFQVS